MSNYDEGTGRGLLSSLFPLPTPQPTSGGLGSFASLAPSGLGTSAPVGGLAGLGMPAVSPETAALAAALLKGTELHTKPQVAHIAGIGASHPENLTNEQVQSLCGEVLRHIRRMEGKG